MKRLLLAVSGLILAGGLIAVAVEPHRISVNVATGLAALTNTTVTSTAGTAFTIPANTDLAFEPTFFAANPGTSNNIFGINLTGDGTNFSTTLPVTATVACAGTNVTTGWVVLSRTNFVGAKMGRLDSISTTQTNQVTISGCAIDYIY